MHKLARIVYHLLSTGESYNESVFHKCEEVAIKRAEIRLRQAGCTSRISNHPESGRLIVPLFLGSRLLFTDPPRRTRWIALWGGAAFLIPRPIGGRVVG